MRNCPACGQPVPLENRFCGQCGSRMPATGPLPPLPPEPAAPAPSTERREVTVVFVDVTNFTAASRTLDSEEVFTWMDSTMRSLSSVIAQYEGHIDKFTGDGLMALFGVPKAHENDPERAVRAALEMHAAIQSQREHVKQTFGIEFMMRIGINTGTVIAGNVGGSQHAEYTVLGDTVNLASRLEKSAQPGTVLVSETTYARTAPLFEYVALAPLTVKGVSEALRTYRPLRPADAPGSLRGLAGRQVPMIGREQDVALLLDLFNGMERERRSRVGLISGEAGMGKSRLVRELRHAITGSHARAFQAACYDHSGTTPLALAAELLRGIIGIAQSEPHEQQRNRIETYLRARKLSINSIQPYVHSVIGLEQPNPESAARLSKLDPSMLQRQLHASVRQIILAETNRAPVVLILDDLHWIDPASRDLLQYILETTSQAPLFAVLVSRYFAGNEPLEALKAAAERGSGGIGEIRLSALSATSGRELIEKLLHEPGEGESDLAWQIMRRSAGNPFYIEEIVRTLIDQGGLVAVEGGLAATPRAASVVSAVPENLRALILARFDRLTTDLKIVLQHAAAIGRVFPPRLLAAAAELDETLVTMRLRDLAEREFLVARPLGPETGYTFQHMLVQDAIYETLLRRDRQRIHGQVAAAIEQGNYWSSEEQTEALAYHYAESATSERAIPLLVAAAENAARRYANETAISHFRRSLDLMQAHPGHYGSLAFRTRVGLGRALRFLGNYAEAVRVLEEALERLQIATIDRSEWLAHSVDVLGELADARLREGALDRSATHLEAGLTLIERAGTAIHQREWRSLMNRLASVRLRQGNIEQALTLADTAVRDANDDDPITMASLYGILGGGLFGQGRLEDATSYVEQSLALYNSLGYTQGMASAQANLGVLYYARGLWARAVDSLDRANALRREIGYMPEQAVTLANLGLVRLAMGDHERAERDLTQSLGISRQIGDDYGIVRAEIGLGHLAVIRQEFAHAAEHIAAARQRMESAGEDEDVQSSWLHALVLAAQGELASAAATTEHALQTARDAGLAEQETECMRVLGRIFCLQGKYAEAEAILRDAVDICRRRADSYQRGLALHELGRVYMHRLSVSDEGRNELAALAEAAMGGAAGLFESLGATFDLAQARSDLEKLSSYGVPRRDPSGSRGYLSWSPES